MNEAETCRKYVVPLLQLAGRDTDPHAIVEQHCFTAGRIVSRGETARRRPGKRADYLLRYTRDLTLAVVEATAAYKHPADGVFPRLHTLPPSAKPPPAPPLTAPPPLPPAD